VAKGGTLLIDEVAEMPPAMQAKLLRVLEDGHYRRVGGTQEIHADVRIIAATNKPLEDEQKAGRFREDLFYRLNVITVNLPPLRDRREDIPALVEHLLTTRQIGGSPFEVDLEAMSLLCAYDWPGNIRELANVLERAQILGDGNTITADILPENLLRVISDRRPAGDAADGPYSLEAMERRQVELVLKEMKGNKVHAAQALGVSRRSLYRMIERYRLEAATLGNHEELVGLPPIAS
jgi:two-component system response regulator AtoC